MNLDVDVDVAAACFGGGWQIALRLSQSRAALYAFISYAIS